VGDEGLPFGRQVFVDVQENSPAAESRQGRLRLIS
jgi:hypothetical protein